MVRVSEDMSELGYRIRFVPPAERRTCPLPHLPGHSPALVAKPKVWHTLDGFRTGALHVATEGPLGVKLQAVIVT